MSASSSAHTAAPRTLATAGLPRRVRKVLEQALALVSIELDLHLGTMLGELEQELYRLADTARDTSSQSEYMQALRALRLNRADLIPRVMLGIESELAAIRSPIAAATTASPDRRMLFGDLSLVEDTAIDEATVLGEIASRQEGRATFALHLLGQRFGVLAGTPAFDAARIPLGPRALCRAMRDASHPLQIGDDARRRLYRIFDRQVMASYANTLETLDATMAAAGVLPGLSFVPPRVRAIAQDEPKPASDVAGTAASASARAATAAAAAAPGPAAAAAAPPRTDPQRPHAAWMGEIDSGSAADEGASLVALQQLIAGRRELLGKLRPSRQTGPLRDQLSTQDVFATLGQLQALPPSTTGAARGLHGIRQALLVQTRQQRGGGAALSQKDNDTFELLNMLYGQLESEIRADAPGAALIRRLQVPLLRVALQDRAFFVRGRHPARQLLNAVAESAARWLGDDDFDPQMLAPLQQAVTHVVEHYNGDDAVFAASNDSLGQHLRAQARKAEMIERRHVEAARGKEKLEVAKRRAAQTLTALIGNRRLARFVRALLNQAWADVLTLTLLRQGEHSGEWRQRVDITRQIIAACGLGGTPTVPGLRAHLEAALIQVGYHADEAEVIAQRLTSTDSDDDNDAASRTELTVKLKARSRLGENATAASKPLPLPPPRTRDEQGRYEQLRVLPFGTWIEFTTNPQDDVVRRRLSWFSPITDNALFVNQRGQRIGEQSLDSLARMLASGQAKIVTAERARLVDRAWQAVVSALRSFAGRNDQPPLAEAT